MATVAVGSQLTLLEMANRLDPKGDLVTIAEVLDENNPFIQDAPWVEANEVFSHKYTQRLTLPSGSVRGMNEGVSTEASQTISKTAELSLVEARSENDIHIIDNMPNPKGARMQESRAFIEGLGHTHADLLLYGNNNADPRKYDGLATLMGSLATTTNVLDAGGAGSDLTSVYVVQWGVDKVFIPYPRGAKKLGIDHQDLGIESVLDANNKKFRAYVDMFTLWSGLCIKNSKCVGRIANIETTGTTNIFDEDDLITLLNRMKNGGAGAIIYVNEVVKTQMEIILKDKANVNFTASKGEGLAGEEVLYFRGHPIKLCDRILKTESEIS